jgi:hypothetical protein
LLLTSSPMFMLISFANILSTVKGLDNH